MATKKQIAANRANAKKSTGPTSKAGLEKSSQNRRNHGLCGQFKVLENEPQGDFDELLAAFIEAEQPADAVEHELVVRMAQQRWMSDRAVRLQNACFLVVPDSLEIANDGSKSDQLAINKDLDKYLRYQASSDRAYQRAAADLAKRKKARQLEKNGFESQKRAEAREIRAEAQEIRRQERHRRQNNFDDVKLANAKLDFELKAQRILDQNPNLTPPRAMKSAA